jgi:hypothetical protein
MLLIPTLLCPKPWEKMDGNEARRYCSSCQKIVHNLDALSVEERLALLSSPAATVCGRYQAAIRRPAKGREKAYRRHLLKYGAGVALTGAVLLVLWEIRERSGAGVFYRAAKTPASCCPMPKALYDEHKVNLLGDVFIPASAPQRLPAPDAGSAPPAPIDLKLDPAEVERLIQQARQDPNSG